MHTNDNIRFFYFFEWKMCVFIDINVEYGHFVWKFVSIVAFVHQLKFLFYQNTKWMESGKRIYYAYNNFLWQNNDGLMMSRHEGCVRVCLHRVHCKRYEQLNFRIITILKHILSISFEQITAEMEKWNKN